jgi:serine/threonine protein kinase
MITKADRIGIDFIGRLLEKDAMQRMTLTDALEHEWLALPSSQHSEGPVYQLGGDSMYGITDFDNISDDGSVSFGAASEWSRPMTASGTNLESGMGLADVRGGSVESDDSYSQKVEDFHLNSSPRTKARGTKSAPHPLSLSTANPPSPPLTDERMEIGASALETSNGNGNEAVQENHVVRSPNTNGVHIVSGAETPNTATKRKALELDLFASGSLSPPPQEDIELSSPLTSIRPSTPKSAEQPSSIEARPTRRTTRSSVKPNGTPVARGRKSMRLT